MTNSAYRTQCRRCKTIVYDGKWISPAERLGLHREHRGMCPADVIPIQGPRRDLPTCQLEIPGESASSTVQTG